MHSSSARTEHSPVELVENLVEEKSHAITSLCDLLEVPTHVPP